MARKNVLTPQTLVSAQSLAADFTTNSTNVTFTDNIAIQINITTTDSTGNFTVQSSMDGTNWADLSLSGTPVANAANDTIFININQFPGQLVRVKYTHTVAGTGTCSIILMYKQVGG